MYEYIDISYIHFILKGRKRRDLSPEYKLRWIEQPVTRKSGRVDFVRSSFIILILSSTC